VILGSQPKKEAGWPAIFEKWPFFKFSSSFHDLDFSLNPFIQKRGDPIDTEF